jgi:hypothetical protein
MSRLHNYYQERQPRPNDRYYQMLAQRQAVINAWQEEEELKKQAEGAATIEAEKAEMNLSYLNFSMQESIKH